ncbi:4261_t:CDS:2 [Funneliformis caledonium]|uniref:4261_t:CDS:1 n=1 Tax=Funneliformis caledonium TaxID=1117310 RepID=A0A9N8Z5V2_9GLOM|nr:4261_t:CDS:2 [Funneliformis caledonium]
MIRCLLNIEITEQNTVEKNVVVLKPNREFLMWSPSSSTIERNVRYTTSRNLIDQNSFHIFKQHYLEALNGKGKRDDISKFNRVHKEIVEAWKNADKEVIEESNYQNCSMDSLYIVFATNIDSSHLDNDVVWIRDELVTSNDEC